MRIVKRVLNAIAASALLIPTTLSPIHASESHEMEHHQKVGDLMLAKPFARASATPLAKAGASFISIKNTGTETDRLIAASSDAANRVELHTHMMTDGVMQMRHVENIEIAPGQTIVMKPGGYHLMMFDLTAPLKKGSHFMVTLTFEKAGDVSVMVPVLGVAAHGPEGDDDDHGEGQEHGHTE